MPLDPSIYAQLDTQAPLRLSQMLRDWNNPMRDAQQALTLRGLLQSGKLTDFQLQQAQQQAQDAAAQREIYKNTPDISALPDALMKAGFGKQAIDLRKESLGIDKTKAETGKLQADTQRIQLEQKAKQYDDILNAFGSAKDQRSYENVAALLANKHGPELLKAFPAQFDPAWVQTAAEATRTAQQRVMEEIEKTKMAQAERHNLATEQNAAAQTAIARGHLGVSQGQLSVAQGRLALDRAMPRGVLDPERGLLVDPRTGEARPVTMDGKPVGMSKKLTELQGKAQLFGARMAQSDQILKSLEDKISTTGLAAKRGLEKVPGIGGILGSVGNTMLSDNQQKVEQAQRDFMNAVLRQESGAVIRDEEFENGQRQYFPVPGDSKAVIEQKRENRKNAIRGMKVMAGPAGDLVSPTPIGEQSVSEGVGKVLTYNPSTGKIE